MCWEDLDASENRCVIVVNLQQGEERTYLSEDR